VNEQGSTPNLAPEDRELVDLLRAVLVDPNLHTDRQMRLHREISAILRSARRDLWGASATTHTSTRSIPTANACRTC
jgi:hypothetical protein